MFLINSIYLSSSFMLDNVFKIPAHKNRDIMNHATSYMKRVRKIFYRDYFVFNVIRCQAFDFFSNRKNFHRIFIYNIYKKFPFFNIRRILNFYRDHFRAIERKMAKFSVAKEILSNAFDSFVIAI